MANKDDTIRGSQAQINIISTFCERPGMQLNLKETEFIVFRNDCFLKDTEKWYIKRI